MDQEKEPSKRAVIISVAFSVIVLSYVAYMWITRNVALTGKVRYTIGYTVKFQLTMSGRDVKYTYMVNGRSYEDVATYAYDSQVPGGRYWVKFSVKNPEHSELYQNKSVPEHIMEVPADGWDKRPW